MVAAVLASYGLCRLVFNALGLRLVGAATVGTVNIALSMAVLVSLPVSAGVAPSVSRYLPLLSEGAPRGALRRWALRMGTLWMLGPAALFLIVYGVVLRAPYGAAFAPLVILWSALYGAYALCRAEQFAGDTVARALWLEAAAVTLFAVALSFLMTGRTGAWIPFSVYYLPAVVWLAVRSWRAAGGTAPVPRREMQVFAAFSLMGSAASLGIAYSTTVVVSATSGRANAGLWATLISVAAPLLLAPRTLNSSFFPRLSLLGRSSPEGFVRLTRLHQRFASLFALGSVGAALVLTRAVLDIAVGEASAGPLTSSWMLIAIACYGIFRGEPLNTACGALGRARLTATAAFVGAGACAIVWVAALPRAGMPGVAAGYMVYTLVVPAIILVVTRFRGPSPPAFLFFSDAVFVAVAVATALFGAAGEPTGRIAALAAIVVTLAHGLVRVRRELRELPLAPADGSVEQAPAPI